MGRAGSFHPTGPDLRTERRFCSMSLSKARLSHHDSAAEAFGWTTAAAPAGRVADAPSPQPAESASVAGGISGSQRAPAPADADDGGVLPPLVRFSDLVQDAPAWLFSAVLHMLVLILLALLLIARPGKPGLLVEFAPSDEAGEDLDAGDFDLALDLDQPPLEDSAAAVLPDLTTVDLSESLLSDPTASALNPAATSATIELGLTGREAGMKAALLEAYGGTAATEAAVHDGLAWLARYQHPKTALWNMSGKYANGVNRDNPEAATALALIAFQGAGYTPQSDPKDSFTRVVTRAWPALLKRQQDDGNFFNTGTTHGALYTHALCTIALCEVYGMTDDEAYRDAAQLAVDYCVATQSEGGGWRYFPGQEGDLSVTGWFVMALQSARMAGLNVPSETLTRIGEFLDTVSRDGGSQYAYTATQPSRLAMTAEGLLCRQYLGWRHDDRRLNRGADLLVKNLPSWNAREAYYWYYAAQVCHHMEGRHWREWNTVMRELLPAKQVKKGRERGSWDPVGDVGNSQGGRHFITCLSIYMLEVYYRHLPIYQLDLLGGK